MPPYYQDPFRVHPLPYYPPYYDATRGLGGGFFPSDPSPFDPSPYNPGPFAYTRGSTCGGPTRSSLGPGDLSGGVVRETVPSPDLGNRTFLTRCALGLKAVAEGTESTDLIVQQKSKIAAASYLYGAIGYLDALGIDVKPFVDSNTVVSPGTRGACGDAGEALEKFVREHLGGGTRGESWGRDLGNLVEKVDRCVGTLGK